MSVNYTSPYAGAYFSLANEDGNLKYSEFTYKNMDKLREKLGGKGSGIGTCKSTENIQQDFDSDYLEKRKFADDLEIGKSQVPGCDLAVLYKAFIFNSPLLIANLLRYLTKLGVNVKREKLNDVKEAFKAGTKTVFNCSGLGALKLGGVEDTSMIPTRGQVVVIRAPYINECYLAWNDTSTYIIKRPDSNLDEVILGGFYQKDVHDSNTYGYEIDDILQRTIKLYPKILSDNPNGNRIEDLQIIRVVAGIRPGRKGGVRIEKQELSDGKVIIHNYGAAGEGYLCSLGMANEAVSLIL